MSGAGMAWRAVLLAIGTLATVGIAGAREVPMPLPPDAQVEGKGQAALTAAWWQWAMSLPVEPYMDADGRWCGLGQDGPVWFLAGTDGSFDAARRCEVPLGVALFLPVVNRFHSTALDARIDDEVPDCAALKRAVAMPVEGLLRANVTIDGVEVPEVALHRVASEDCFDPHPGIAAMAGYQPPLAASDGYWLLVPPPSAGRHLLAVDAHYRSPQGDGYELVQRFEYILQVGAVPQFVGR